MRQIAEHATKDLVQMGKYMRIATTSLIVLALAACSKSAETNNAASAADANVSMPAGNAATSTAFQLN